MQELLLAEKLIGYDTSNPEGIRLCAGFVKGWLEARDIPTQQLEVRELPIVIAEVGPAEGPVDRHPRPHRRRPRPRGPVRPATSTATG